MKKLITAETIRQQHAAGKQRLEVELPATIITPEARTLATQLHIELVESVAPRKEKTGTAVPAASAIPQRAERPAPHPEELAAIRAAIVARLPKGSVSDDVIEQLIRKALDEKSAGVAAVASGPAEAKSEGAGYGIKHVKGSSVQFSRFDGAGAGNTVGLSDVITASDHSPMAAGYMAWSNCFFPWTLTYDEIDVILEGELHIRHQGKTVIGLPGDVIFIPKGSAIEFGTPSTVRFLYVTYPADWQNQ
ncbi:ethanolamine utilization acetate kinase EutQ [Azonexus sp. IMCC34842]|uniref:ethanolamine utilization acetate kinase EutQ n=1 Tax=Azonexus sp. IMCC34842 TaxID=3420950 RepID=UPI003D130029